MAKLTISRTAKEFLPELADLNSQLAPGGLLQAGAENSCNSFIDGLNEGALTLSPENIILYCNGHFAHLLNSTTTEVIGSQLDNYILPDDRIKLKHVLKKALSPENIIDLSCQPARGVSPVMLRISVNSLPSVHGCGKVFLLAYDISGFIRMENELRLVQSTLEKNVVERTSKLTLANDAMIASRMATLSMMEDAVEANSNLEATNRKLVEEIIERKRAELIHQVLFSISNAALITRDLEELIQIIRSELGKLLDTKNFYIAFYDEASDTLSTPYVEDEKDDMDSWPAAKSMTGYVIRNNKKILINAAEIAELARQKVIELIGSSAMQWLGVPLEVDGRVIGAFVVQSYDNANAYDSKDLDLLEFISHQISISIQRKKALQDLTTALSKAKESDLLKTAFLHNISHEIRTPMNAILGFSDLLNDPGLHPDEQKSYTDIICKSGKHLLTMLEDIINISELEAGKEVFMPRKTMLNPMLRDIYEQYKFKAGRKNIELIITQSLADEQSYIITDETKLIQIISNLLNNALKFTAKGRISIGYVLKKGNLEFYVKDTGVGISDDKFKTIFDRFKQVEIVLSNENGGRGLGLGLSISQAYVQLFGGEIWVTSEPGVGSEFYFSIPYTPVVIQKNEDRPITGIEVNNRKIRKTILIAEAKQHNYLHVSELLAGSQANIIYVSNGHEALQTCKAAKQIDMVIMDIHMAEMDGFEAAKSIRELMPDLPLIALTPHASMKEEEKAIKCGFNEYCVRPLEVSKLKALINKYLDNYFNIKDLEHLAS
jgi:signal transduction histidine kinase/ActR/RegA family two-component response regulator